MDELKNDKQMDTALAEDQSVFEELGMSSTVIAVIIGVVGLVFAGGVLHVSADEYVAKAAQYISTQAHDLNRAATLFEKALKKDPKNKEALISVARVYYITAQYEKSFAVIDEIKALYPQERRAYYIGGLAHAFAGDFETAEAELQTFVDFGGAGWQGYLDLAWVQFQQGKYEEARSVLKSGIAAHGHNAWLDTSLGAVLVALGENDEAQRVLGMAKVQMENVTEEEWRHNYSFNASSSYQNSIANMEAAIELNLKLARGDSDAVLAAQALESSFIAASPGGFSQGLAVSACGQSNSCTTGSCISQPNACGQVSAGTYQTCTVSGSTSCNASTPSLPNGYGDSCQRTNSCGNTASGTIGCDGTCNAAPPGSCNPFAPSISAGACTVGELYTVSVSATDPEGESIRYGVDWDNDGVVDQYMPSEGYVASGTTRSAGNIFSSEGVKTIRIRTENESGSISSFTSHTFTCTGSGSPLLDGGEEIDGAITAQPLLVRSGEPTTLVWDTNGVESCTVSGTNDDSFEGTSGTESSSALTSQTTFVLDCDDGTVLDSVTVNIVPLFEEI